MNRYHFDEEDVSLLERILGSHIEEQRIYDPDVTALLSYLSIRGEGDGDTYFLDPEDASLLAEILEAWMKASQVYDPDVTALLSQLQG